MQNAECKFKDLVAARRHSGIVRENAAGTQERQEAILQHKLMHKLTSAKCKMNNYAPYHLYCRDVIPAEEYRLCCWMVDTTGMMWAMNQL